ncbi:DUF115 domain-containing protein [Rhodospirillales bacterium]|nr:DUF115 domain-containing protein [Rhodospirillales bacterium]
MPERSHLLEQKNLAVFEFISPRVAEMLRASCTADRPEKKIGMRRQRAMRFPMNAPMRQDIDLHSFDFIERLLEKSKKAGVRFFDAPRTERSYYLLLIGAPNTEDLLSAIEKHDPRCLIIGIGNSAQFANSLKTVDWGRCINDFQSRGGAVYLLPDTDPEAVVERVWKTCRSHNPTQIDNFTVIVQNGIDPENAAIAMLAQTIMLSIAQLGFFHDETVMLWNTYQNRTTNRVRLFQRQTEPITDVPCFVVASGPSLEKDIMTIKANKEHAVVISVASSLRSLLNAGVTPDFHVELENVYITPKFAELSETYDISDIKLVAAASVEPAVFDYINEAILYARYELSSYPVFAKNISETLRLSSPTAGNAALSFALESGFHDVYLFGLDLGTYDVAKHHAKDSYYYTAGALEHPDVYDISIPGNFRDQVWTSRPFLSALKNAADLANIFATTSNIMNCSDGARIDNTAPFNAADINLNTPTAAKALALKQLNSGFHKLDVGDEGWPGSSLERSINKTFKQLQSVLTDTASIHDGTYEKRFLEILDLNMGYLDPPKLGPDSSAVMLVRGTILSIITFMERYRARVAYSSEQLTFSETAASILGESLTEIHSLAIDLLGAATPNAPLAIEARVASPGRTFPAPIRIPRNVDCPCGSTEKYKRCHGKVT